MVDFKLGNLELKICGWLHKALIEVKAMKSTIIKRWNKTCITITFLLVFQLIAMEANSRMPLLKKTIIAKNNNKGKC
jgi:hypothetical protein